MSIKNTAKGSFCPLQSKKKCPEKLSKIQTKCARSVFPFNLENFWSKVHDENRRFFQLPSVVEQQVDVRFSFFIITQTVVMLKILYILVNDELYLQF